ncbi:MAG: nucleoside triphosphate pyrophosphohydrolase [Acidimicrobiia bacterium]|nr:nucleoside triphosphate pyrophosphohydrolase [Acidimicrobiia bacterium]
MVGLGPAGPELLSTQVREAIDVADRRLVRTRRHPAAEALDGFESLDRVYDAADRIGDVYPAIVEELVAFASAGEQVLYAVPGSPDVAERSVELLRADGRVPVEVLPALSFLDLAWNRLGIDPLAAGVRLVDGRDFAVAAAGAVGPILVAQCDRPDVLSDIKLAVDDPGAATVTVLARLGLPDEVVFDVAWDDLDRAVEPDHLTSLYVPELAAPVAGELARFVELVGVLRRECPWDREQTHRTLTRHLVEETYEVLEAIDDVDPDTGDGYEALEEELGDLLFQVVFHATLAAEEGRFTVADVARGIHDKLHRRHPHVFGDVVAEEADHVVTNWERIKRDEKGRASVMDGIPTALPALLLALKVQKKAKGAGMDFPSVDDAYAKVAEELAEVREHPAAEEVGDLLFSVAGVAQQLSIDPEEALRSASRKFADRFRRVEALAAGRDLDLVAASDDEVDELWRAAKEADTP